MPTHLLRLLCLTLALLGSTLKTVDMPQSQSAIDAGSTDVVHTTGLVHPLKAFAMLLLASNAAVTFIPSIPGARLAIDKSMSGFARARRTVAPVVGSPEQRVPAAGFHHIAFVTKDPCATRHFFEDLLGLKMVHCEGGPGLMHAFFDAGAGASMAFFLFDTAKLATRTDLSDSLGLPKWLNRAAYRVTREQADAVRDRLRSIGMHDLVEISHGWCKSLYFPDPNGVMVELCVDTPGVVPDSQTAKQRWLEEDPRVFLDESSSSRGLSKMMSAWPSTLSVPSVVSAPQDIIRGTNEILSEGFHHLCFTTKDVAATRHFYEDLFGFPLVHCELDGSGNSWIKTAFFDVGRGSFIAFQAFNNIGEKSDWHSDLNGPLNFPVWANHAAFRATFDEVISVRSRMESEGIQPVMEMSHGWCYSLYYRDPNGVTVELCVDTPGFQEDRAEAVRMWEASARPVEV